MKMIGAVVVCLAVALELSACARSEVGPQAAAGQTSGGEPAADGQTGGVSREAVYVVAGTAGIALALFLIPAIGAVLLAGQANGRS